ncbi:MAG: glycogen synthase GlgA [Alphaproteobacteria bacterium]
MRVLFAAAEIFPFVKTGGLGDVVAALPAALAGSGMDVRLMLPGYSPVLAALERPRTLCLLPAYFGSKDARIVFGRLPNGLETYVVDAPHFYDRLAPYGDSSGRDWPDNHLRFAALSRAAADISLYDELWAPDVIHGNDWHTGLIPAYLSWRGRARPASVITIHNLAFQGLFSRSVLPQLHLNSRFLSGTGHEFYSQVGFLKAGLYYADKISAVSPSYAREIQTPEFGCGLDSLLRARARDLRGILNGIDTEVWNPASDPFLDENYDARSIKQKALNKAAVLRDYGFDPACKNDPLFAVVSRLTSQKGVDLLPEVLPPLLKRGLRLIVLGNGEVEIEKQLAAFAATYPKNVVVDIGYDERRAHRIQAGADALIAPSRFEPCGLVQLYALRYGTLPVVRRTGGLADTVVDAGRDHRADKGTGFVFSRQTVPALRKALDRAMNAYQDKTAWGKLQRNAMAQDVGWTAAAGKYGRLYEEACQNLRIQNAFSRGTASDLPPLYLHGGQQDGVNEPAFGKA